MTKSTNENLLNVCPEFKKRKFSFIAAALFAKDHSGLGVYIKYGRPKGFNQEKIKIVSKNPWWMHILTPDRELLIVKDGYRSTQMRPLDQNWDEFVSWSQFHLTAIDYDDAIYMVNYAQHFMESRDYNFNMAKTMPFGEQRNFKYISDSGGFQIFKQKIDFISPADAAIWYDTNVDLGIAADVPVVIDDYDLFIRSAYVQKANNAEMLNTLKSLNSKVELVNIGHGQTFEQQVEYINIVGLPEVRRLALGDIYRNSILVSVDMLSRILYKFKDQYDHFHVLGVYNLALLPAIILMANKYPIKYMTSDSSTHLQSGINKMYHHQSLPESPGRRISIGIKKGEGTRLVCSSHKVLPCSCAVCGAIKYFDILSMIDGSMLSFTLAQHNLFEINRYVKFMDAMARDLTQDQYTNLVLGQLSNKSSRQETKYCLDYIYAAAKAGGPEEIRKKYVMYLGNGLFKQKVNIPVELFGEEVQDFSIEEIKKRTNDTLTKYENHHAKQKQKTEKIKDKVEKKDKQVKTMFSKKKKINSKGIKSEMAKNKSRATKKNKAKSSTPKTQLNIPE